MLHDTTQRPISNSRPKERVPSKIIRVSDMKIVEEGEIQDDHYALSYSRRQTGETSSRGGVVAEQHNIDMIHHDDGIQQRQGQDTTSTDTNEEQDSRHKDDEHRRHSKRTDNKEVKHQNILPPKKAGRKPRGGTKIRYRLN